MGSIRSSKAKGYRWEKALVEYLQTHGFPLARRTGSANRSLGDIEGVGPVVLEAKNWTERRLDEWLEQAQASAVRKGVSVYLVIEKKHDAPVEEAYVHMTWEVFVLMLNMVFNGTTREDMT